MGLSPPRTPHLLVVGGAGVAASAVRGIVVVVRPEVPFSSGVYGRSEGLSHGAWGGP